MQSIVSCIFFRILAAPWLTFQPVVRPYLAYYESVTISNMECASFCAHGSRRAVCLIDVERPPNGNKPLQPSAGDCAGLGHGRAGAACGVESPPGGKLPATRRRSLVARSARRPGGLPVPPSCRTRLQPGQAFRTRTYRRRTCSTGTRLCPQPLPVDPNSSV
jgi:hypothetical protein